MSHFSVPIPGFRHNPDSSAQGAKCRPKCWKFATSMEFTAFLSQVRKMRSRNDTQHRGATPIRHSKHEIPKIKLGFQMNIIGIDNTFGNDSVGLHYRADKELYKQSPCLLLMSTVNHSIRYPTC